MPTPMPPPPDTALEAPAQSPLAFAVALQASEPFLDHHRPGGQPLLGTAMGIALMCSAARRLLRGDPARPLRVEHVEVFAPFVLRADSASVQLRASQASGGETDMTGVTGAVACELQSQQGNAPPTVHFRAAISASDASRAQPPRPATVRPDAPPSVDAADVYALFFHGPAFRVVAGATWVDDGMRCAWRQGLPAWRHGPIDDAAPDPRWVELALQTAGLLEVASTQRMLIPHHIDAIEHSAWPGPHRPQHLFAHARRAPRDEAIDIDVTDPHGQPILRVSGYRTLPLPFKSDDAALAALAERFRLGRRATPGAS